MDNSELYKSYKTELDKMSEVQQKPFAVNQKINYKIFFRMVF